jgi:hypothetical protein
MADIRNSHDDSRGNGNFCFFPRFWQAQVVPANNQLEDAFAYQRQLSFIEPCLPFARGQATVRLQLVSREKHDGFSEPIALAMHRDFPATWPTSVLHPPGIRVQAAVEDARPGRSRAICV